ncbi:MAG: HDOD domain-containing protein [Bacteroidetes bacterium]|nr:MAG: HDOD domain-containing protein [Bacteroidota bacterium]
MHTLHSRPNAATEPLKLRFPPLPQTLLEAVQLMDLPGGPDVDQVVKMVERDPMVVSRLLSVVNSAYYGLSRRIEDVRRAVVALGPVSVTGIVMSMNLLEMQTALTPTTALPFLNLIRHSIATAYLARHLVQEDPALQNAADLRDRASGAFTAGLLHDFGKVVLLYSFPEETAALYQPGPDDPPPTPEAERERLGINHLDAWMLLAERIHASDVLTSVVGLHHACPPYAIEDDLVRYLAAVVAAANAGARAMGYALVETDTVEPADAAAWEALVELSGYPGPEAMQEAMQEAREGLEGYAASLL